jgi:uncharacterized protein YraI
MHTRSLLLAGALAGAFAWSVAEAAPGTATGSVNLRTGPGTSYAVITTIPAGARVNVQGCPSWCQVTYNGQSGWASSNYISAAAYGPAPVVVGTPRYVAPGPVVVDIDPLPARRHWRYGRPWWDDRYHAWYDGHGWWYDGRWHDTHPRAGFFFSFSG